MNLKSSLQLIEIYKIMLHEPYEPARLIKIKNAINLERVVRNPIIALSLDNDKYLVLDGAHRLNALKEMGCRRVPLQIVDSNQLVIQAWHHLVSTGEWLEKLLNHPSIDVTKTCRKNDEPIASLSFHDNEQLYLYVKESNFNISKKLEVWHEIVNSYSNNQEVTRLSASNKEGPKPGFVRLHYPATCLETIRKVVQLEKLFPAGVTQFIVNGRFLNLRIPFQFLISENVNELEWEIMCKHLEDNLRLYSENVYLYEA